MNFHELLARVAKILNDYEIPYAVTGGYAVSVWGRPRATFDIDIIIELHLSDIEIVRAALKGISKISYIDEEAMKEAVQREGEFNFIYSESNLKVDFFVVGSDNFSKQKLTRRIALDINNEKIYFVSPEDLILSKLLWYKDSQSTRQLEDVESIFKIQKDKIDFDYLRKWALAQKTDEILESLLNKQ